MVLTGIEPVNTEPLAEGGFDPPTFGLWAQRATTAPFCFFSIIILQILNLKWGYNPNTIPHSMPFYTVILNTYSICYTIFILIKIKRIIYYLRNYTLFI